MRQNYSLLMRKGKRYPLNHLDEDICNSIEFVEVKPKEFHETTKDVLSIINSAKDKGIPIIEELKNIMDLSRKRVALEVLLLDVTYTRT